MGLHVSLPPALESKVHKEVESGMYGTASELVREALRLFFSRNEEPAWIAPEMRRRVEALDRGDYKGKMVDGETFFAELEQQYPDSL
jgi:antitoxin ParD1/3/4